MPLAHVKWFVEDPHLVPLDWGRLLSAPVAAGILLAIGAGLVLWSLGRLADEERLTRWFRRVLRPYLPLLLSGHLGIALAAYAMTGRYLAPGLDLPPGGWGTVLAWLQLAVAVLIVAGLLTRVAAGLLVLSGPIGMLFYGVIPMLERVELLGIALYLAVVGRRRWSVDAYLAKRPIEPPAMNPSAVALLRVLAGLAVAVSALTEKLLAPGVSEAFLRRFPDFNVLSGFGVSDRGFIELAGAIELAIGLLLLSGVATRLAVLVAVVPFNVTLLFFGWEELIGHLPIYGIFLVLVVEGPGRLLDAAAWRRAGRTARAVSSGTGGSGTSSGSRP